MERVAALVEELEQVPEATLRVRREDPRWPWRPGTGRRLVGGPRPMPSVNATGTGGRPGRGTDVVGIPSVARIRAEGAR